MRASLSAQVLAILLLVLGEAGAILVELLGAHAHRTLPFGQVFVRGIALIVLSSALLLAGYMLGYRAFQNIWVVSAISITSILILEPVLAYSIFGEVPTRGAVVGLGLGALGFVATLAL